MTAGGGLAERSRNKLLTLRTKDCTVLRRNYSSFAGRLNFSIRPSSNKHATLDGAAMMSGNLVIAAPSRCDLLRCHHSGAILVRQLYNRWRVHRGGAVVRERLQTARLSNRDFDPRSSTYAPPRLVTCRPASRIDRAGCGSATQQRQVGSKLTVSFYRDVQAAARGVRGRNQAGPSGCDAAWCLSRSTTTNLNWSWPRPMQRSPPRHRPPQRGPPE